MNAPEYDALNRKLNSEAMTLLRNSQNLIPITHLNKGRIAVVSVGNDTESVFQKTITLYADNVGRFDDSNPLPSLLDRWGLTMQLNAMLCAKGNKAQCEEGLHIFRQLFNPVDPILKNFENALNKRIGSL